MLLGSAFIDVAQGANSNPCSVDAAVTFENDLVYFFKGDKYGRYSADRQIDYIGPISAWKGVPSDIDAAIKYKGNYYFFKGCHYYIWDVDAGKVVLDKRDIQKKWKAPCNLDAAITMGSYVYLFKGNKYWLWWNGDGKPVYKGGNKDIKSKFGVDGPFDAVVRWDPFDKYYFFQGEYYRRLDDGKLSGKEKSILNWKGLVDSGRELLRDCPCSCNRLEHNENWEFKSIDYNFDKADVKQKILKGDLQTMRIDMLDVAYCQFECPLEKKTLETINTEKESFTSLTGFGLKVGTSFSVGIPAMAKAGVKTEVSVSQSFTFGKEKTHSKSISSTFTCYGYPKLYTKCTVSEYLTKMDLPYTMMLKHKKKGCVCPSKGIFHKAELGTLNMETKYFDKREDVM